jgi:integrase
MSEIFRPTYHARIPDSATYYTKKGKQWAKFYRTKSGTPVSGEVVAPGRARVRSPYYYARITKNGKSVRVPLKVTDRKSALQLWTKLQLAADHQRAGVIDRFGEHRATPLTTHLEEYRQHQQSCGYSAEHVLETYRLLTKICRTCGWNFIEEFSLPAFNRYLLRIIRDGKSFRTRNKALESLRAFVHWLIDNERLEIDPFRTIKALNEDADPNRRIRRALSSEELSALFHAAEIGPVVQGITGRERTLIYSVCATTGLRAKETASLRVQDLVFDEIPYIVLPPTFTKNRQEAVLPLHPTLAAKLQQFVVGREGNEPLFNLRTTAGKMRLTYDMMRKDTEAAGIDYKNDQGYADFHALRTSFISATCRLTDQFTVMKLARHSKTTTTAKHYDRVQLAHRAQVVAQLSL